VTLPDDVLTELDELLAPADRALATGWPGEPAGRQPVHTLYLAADHLGIDVVVTIGAAALDAVEAEDPTSMARITGLDQGVVADAWPRVLDKLASEPVEDLRLDLEDGYGLRPDEEEDRHAVAIGEALAGLTGDGMPFRSGVRVKSLEAVTRRRGVRSLDLVLGQLGGELPTGFVVTLPKVTSVEQVQAMVLLCERLEVAHRLPAGSLRFELQVETPQVVLGADGTATVARAVHAAQGRCAGLHFGTYDYSAALGVAAAQQAMDHPVADHATSVMQVAAAQTGVRVSHGSTNILPVGDRAHVEAAWALHARLVLRSLERGIYQGWDLHPAQLVTRYAAVFTFFLEGIDAAGARLKNFVQKAAQATLVGSDFDDAATGQGLLNYFLRAINCGAVTEEETLELTGLTLEELRGRSFVKILKNRTL